MGLKGRPSYKRRRLGQHHVLGYESPVSDDPATLTDTPSIQEFAREELLVKKNPLGVEALKNVHDRLSTNFRMQQQKKVLEQDASRETVYTPENESSQLPTPSPTPTSIEASRHVFHVRIHKLSDELCQAIEDNNTARVHALRGVLETLRATLEYNKCKVPAPRSWLDWPSNRYHLNDVMERDTKRALLEALKNAHIAGLDMIWSLAWYYKVLVHITTDKSSLDYIRDNTDQLKA
ncbi:hypothetical protein SARC_01101 [Sphaeroforma arctica JP610]|uniref:Uncharacterized protein n=1 Tax=Sphaeroforma arctica JP610 TaxID=667725 RepID=A0A0L0GCM6_9EUKA|nr:hypothetical protein SARC_01101 [Sphaeroforma arctica JP610]KNC86767.1 hypothetical protein SARC_01101 [Sphaeroforma arctica JP610]|eukprot:XP_014160669.1 hypothetical protein SARC_01101 [Sphaeroforma arctica JP610]